MALAAGTRLGPYEVLGLLGAGGMGEVYLARDPRLGREIAIKLLPADLAGDRDRLDRLEREARTLAALNHPNIVTLHSIEDSANIRFLTMERVIGTPVSELVERGGMRLARLLDFAIPIADALSAAHDHGIVHRDLKPANVMVTSDGRVKVLDFGLARSRQEKFDPVASAVTKTVTSAGQIVGTVPYMAPEQLRGEAVDQRADIFSFGAMLYELSAGKRPFPGDSAVETASAILREDPQPLHEIRPDLPLRFVQLVARCLEKDRQRRAQSAHDLWQELRDLQEEMRSPSGARIAPARPSRKAQFAALVAIVIFAALVALVVPRVLIRQQAGPPAMKSLAVLPFANLMNDSSQQYFVDGMHEALITELAKLGAIRVTSRNSVLRFSGKALDLKQVARELGVDALIEGSVLKAGGKVRITAQLISGATDEHLWANSYDRELQDVLTLLSDVSHTIAGEVQSKLGGPATPIPPSRTAKRVDPRAWEAYLRARHIFNYGLIDASGQAEYLFKSVAGARKLFDEAVSIDPGFAEAWSGLALMTATETVFARIPAAEGLPAVRAAVRKALEIDSSQGEAYAARGIVELGLEFDFERAKSDLEKALALSPYDLHVRHFYADYLITAGRPQESLAEIRIARDHNPNMPWAHLLTLTHLELATRNDDEIIAEARRLQAAYPKSATSRSIIYQIAANAIFDVLWSRERYEEALAELERAQPKRAATVRELVRSHGARGTMKRLADQAAAAATDATRPMAIASMYAAAQDRDNTFAWLEKALAVRQAQLMYLPALREYDFLRDDPRYVDFIRRTGMPIGRQLATSPR